MTFIREQVLFSTNSWGLNHWIPSSLVAVGKGRGGLVRVEGIAALCSDFGTALEETRLWSWHPSVQPLRALAWWPVGSRRCWAREQPGLVLGLDLCRVTALPNVFVLGLEERRCFSGSERSGSTTACGELWRLGVFPPLTGEGMLLASSQMWRRKASSGAGSTSKAFSSVALKLEFLRDTWI